MAGVDVERAREFVWCNARLLDRRRMEWLLGDTVDSAGVVAALRAYQNPDGGFGQALEPDLRTPTSQPQPAEFALRVLDEVGVFDREIVEPLCDWLLAVTTTEGGVPFVLPSAKAHPHAPWWAGPDDPPADLNPTAAIVGLLHKHAVEHAWVESATSAGRSSTPAAARMSRMRSSPPSPSSSTCPTATAPRARANPWASACSTKATSPSTRTREATCTRP